MYLAVFLFLLSGFEAISEGWGAHSNLILLPVLIASALLSGARDRFSIRTKPSIAQSIAYLVAIAAFLILGALSIVGGGYPWWLNVVVPGLLFVAMAGSSIRRLLDSRSGHDRERWLNLPMSLPARSSTTLVGVVFGVLVATSTYPWYSIASAVTLIAVLIASLIGWRSPWGLPQTGYQWGPIHWLIFAAATATIFALVALSATSNLVTPATSLVIGGVVCALMVVGAFLPPNTKRG